jgi:hypothetical protein
VNCKFGIKYSQWKRAEWWYDYIAFDEVVKVFQIAEREEVFNSRWLSVTVLYAPLVAAAANGMMQYYSMFRSETGREI